MQLVCPNCSARYEIDASLIPDEGRDVQCSNCGHTWFELPPPPSDFAEIQPEDETVAADAPVIEDEAPEPAQEDFPSHAVQAIAAATEDLEDDEIDQDGAPVDEVEESPRETDAPSEPAIEETRLKPRRPADAAALEILREEAERELSQRRAPPSETIETQADLGLDEIRNRETPSRALRARMAHLKTDDEARESRSEVVSDADYQAPRKDLLPDIDEINSTLKPTRKRDEAAPEAIARHRSGFRAGFLLMMLVCIVMIVTYARAPAIARALPSAEPAILTYVDKANAVRDWIDGLLGPSDG